MGHKQQETTIEDTIERAREATRELREAITDSKTREREFKATIEGVRSEMVAYGVRLSRELLDELVRREFVALNDELKGLVLKVEKQVSERVHDLLEKYLQQEVDDAPSLDQAFEARRTLTRWQRAWGQLPAGHMPGNFSIEVDPDNEGNHPIHPPAPQHD